MLPWNIKTSLAPNPNSPLTCSYGIYTEVVVKKSLDGTFKTGRDIIGNEYSKQDVTGKDGIANEMLIGLGSMAKRKQGEVQNCSWKRGIVTYMEGSCFNTFPKERKGLNGIKRLSLYLFAKLCRKINGTHYE